MRRIRPQPSICIRRGNQGFGGAIGKHRGGEAGSRVDVGVIETSRELHDLLSQLVGQHQPNAIAIIDECGA